MNLINLMPHRHRRVQQRRRRFYAGLGLSVLAACVLVLGASFTLERLHAQQLARNAMLEQARAALQKQEAQVRQLQGEIGLLQQRQATASALQQQRNVSVAIFNELARLTPAGVTLTQVRQNDLKLMISGVAVTNERVSDLMASLQHDSTALHQAELVEMRSTAPARSGAGNPTVSAGAAAQDVVTERMVEFTLGVLIRREALGGEGKP